MRSYLKLVKFVEYVVMKIRFNIIIDAINIIEGTLTDDFEVI